MSNAVHKSANGEKLASIAELHYAIRKRSGTVDDVRLAKVLALVRNQTPTDLTAYGDEDVLTAGTVVYIPTTRAIAGAVFVENATLLADLKAHGFDHADKLLAHSAAALTEELSPLPPAYDADDITRALVLTAFLRLDGMDRFTAKYLYDTVGIHSLAELSEQSEAALSGVIATLIATQGRPADLGTQGNAARWRLEAAINTRTRLSELTKARIFQIPIAPADAEARAAHFEALSTDRTSVKSDATLASRLGRLYRFQQYILQGNQAVSARQWSRATKAYQAARAQIHRLAEELGTQANVTDRYGLNLSSVLEVSRQVLLALPPEDESPLEAPPLPLRFNQRGTRGFGLRAFRYGELATTGTDRKAELRTALGSAPVAKLPRAFRAAADRALSAKTRSQLSGASAGLVSGLVSGADGVLSRDLEAQDRRTLTRNIGAVSTSALYSGGNNLNVMDEAGDSLALAEVGGLLGSLWSGLSASDVLSSAAAAKYPTAFVAREDVTPTTKYLVLPAATGDADDAYVPLTSGFAADLLDLVYKPRATSGAGTDLKFDDSVWASAGGFAGILPYLYAYVIPLGLAKAYSMLGDTANANSFGMPRFNIWNRDGDLLLDMKDLPVTMPSMNDLDLFACRLSGDPDLGTTMMSYSLSAYCEAAIGEADRKYKDDDPDGARSRYEDVVCVIEAWSSSLADSGRIAMTGVHNSVRDLLSGTFTNPSQVRRIRDLSTLAVQYGDTGTPILPNFISVIDPRSTLNPSVLTAAAGRWFDFHSLPDPTTCRITDQAITVLPTMWAGLTQIQIGGFSFYISGSDDAAVLYSQYLYVLAKIQAIDFGLDWYGYTEGYVPPWSFEFLYGEARNLCDRALAAEERVFNLLEAYEAAQEKEFLAAQQQEMASAQQDIADAKVTEQEALADVATAQAALALAQASAAQRTADYQMTLERDQTWSSFLSGLPISLLSIPTFASSLSDIGAAYDPNHPESVTSLNSAVTQAASAAADATAAANSAGSAVAIAERDAADLAAQQASDYVTFLSEQLLNSDAYEYLLALAANTLEAYLYQANRMAWLAQRALEHETRRSFGFVKIDFSTGDELTDLTRSQQLTQALETTRAEYVAGQTQRMQEIKWTVPLSVLSPGAWSELRSTGSCTFVTLQQQVDGLFPGMYLHRLKNMRLEFLGTLPPEGARGTLSNAGVSWVRVPNDTTYATGTIKDDWVTTSLADSATYDSYDAYVMKQMVTTMLTLALSQFDVSRDQSILSSPQGMLKPVENLGLDTSWTITLPRQSNSFDFADILDVEITLWFLCQYDADLAAAEANALTDDGVQGKLYGKAQRSFAGEEPDDYAEFARAASGAERVDVRRLEFEVDPSALPPWETARKLDNIQLALARDPAATAEITMRIASERDPVGVKVTSVDGAIYTLLRIDYSTWSPPPTPDTVLSNWVDTNYYLTGYPYWPPEGTWIIKVQPATIESDWLEVDEDGNAVTTASGPLMGGSSAALAIASFDGGTGWDNVRFEVTLMRPAGIARACVRYQDNVNYLALAVESTQILLVKVVAGVQTVLGTSALAYPIDEYLQVQIDVLGDVLTVAIDGITVFEDVDAALSSGTLDTGTVALIAYGSATPSSFDDVVVTRLTGLGELAETLVEEPFTGSLPAGWTFANGSVPWAISSTPHNLLDLSLLQNVVLSLSYIFEMDL